MTFDRALLLLTWFTLPTGNDMCTKDAFDTFTNFNLSTAINEFIHSTAIMNVIFKGIHKLFVSFQAVCISDKSFGVNKCLSMLGAIINFRCVIVTIIIMVSVGKTVVIIRSSLIIILFSMERLDESQLMG